jgi:hypothetical protein
MPAGFSGIRGGTGLSDGWLMGLDQVGSSNLTDAKGG